MTAKNGTDTSIKEDKSESTTPSGPNALDAKIYVDKSADNEEEEKLRLEIKDL